MKLYYVPGACSLAAHIALRMAGIDFELDRVDARTKLTSTGEDFRSINAKGYVPALRLAGGAILTEAPAVLQYIADLAPMANLAPAPTTLERARVQEHLNFISSELHKAFRPFFAAEPISDAARPTAEAGIARWLAHVETHFADGRAFLVGGSRTIADVYLFVVANWCNLVGVDLSAWPRTAAFVERMSALPAVRAAMAAEGLLDPSPERG